MDIDEQQSFIHFLAKELKAQTRELMAYQLFAHVLKQAGYPNVDELLDAARKAPALEERFAKNFAGFDELLPPLGLGHEERVKELLLKWKPNVGLPN